MLQQLAVHTAFGAYARGAVIADAATVAEILASADASKVHRLSAAATSLASSAPEPPSLADAIARGVATAEAALHPIA